MGFIRAYSEDNRLFRFRLMFALENNLFRCLYVGNIGGRRIRRAGSPEWVKPELLVRARHLQGGGTLTSSVQGLAATLIQPQPIVLTSLLICAPYELPSSLFSLRLSLLSWLS
jgi:hypothetical protein